MECSRARPTDPPLAGPLQGLKFIEIASIGPGPFCGMMLADHGGEVIRIERIDAASTRPRDAANILNRSRRNIRLDLKTSEGVTVLLDLAARADGLIEGFRPGVMERLGIGPEILLHHNPKLVYGRMTGWGQTGPYKSLAGHDINYLALSGVLDLLGREGQKPTPPINLLGDFGGGGMLLAFGMLAAILHARGSGQGQVVDCSMGEGSALLSSMIWGLRAQQRWRAPRGNNLLDTGAHFYEVYACADGRHIAVGALEPQFYAELRRRLGLSDDAAFDDPHDDTRWPGLKERLAAIFMTRALYSTTSMPVSRRCCPRPKQCCTLIIRRGKALFRWAASRNRRRRRAGRLLRPRHRALPPTLIRQPMCCVRLDMNRPISKLCGTGAL
jgi:alpha-methylacyl-CoA racemase